MNSKKFQKIFVVAALSFVLTMVATVIYAAPLPKFSAQTVIFPLNVSKSANTDTAQPGDTITYTILITAPVTSQLTNLTISDTLPMNTGFVAGSVVISPDTAGGITGTPPNIASGITVATNSVVSVVFAVTVSEPVAAGTIIENTAAVTSTEIPTATLVSAAVTVENAAPVASDGTATTPEDTAVSGTLNASDGNGDALLYTIAGQPANGTVTLGATGTLLLPAQFTYTPTQNFNGEDTFTFTATDGISASNIGTVTVTVTAVNDAPVVDPIATQNVAEQSLLTFTTTATDPNDSPPDALTFSLQNAPSGATINSTTGEFSWTPAEAQGPGVYTPTVVVTDGGSPPLSDTTVVTINVTEVNTAPMLDPIGDFSVDVAGTLIFTAYATDADEPSNTLTFSLQNAPSGASIDSTTGEFSWTPTTAQGGQTFTVTVMVSDDGSPVMTDTEITHITVVNVADLQLSKSGAPLTITAGESSPLLVYTLILENPGPSLAQTVRLTDTLPADVTFFSAVTDKTTCEYSEPQQQVTCEWVQIGSGEQEIITIIVTPDASALDSITNTATVTSTTIDRFPDNNSDTASTTILTAADLSITQSDTPDPTYLGDVVTYTVTVNNNGPSYARNVIVTDDIVGSMNIVDASPACSISGNSISCALGTMVVGATEEITVTARSSGHFNISRTATATATATSDTSDPSSNTAVETTTILPHADLALGKTAFPNPIAAGETMTYTLVVTNWGPSDALGVELTDTLPATVTVGAVNSTQFSCSGTTTISCSSGILYAYTVSEVTIVVTPTQTGTLVNSAFITATTPAIDRDMQNNTASIAVPVTLRTDVGVAMAAAPEPVVAGETMTFTLTATGYGPSTADNVIVTDILPSELTFVSASAGCSVSGQTVSCLMGNLGTGDQAVATIQARVSPAATGIVLNTATVASDLFDENTANNTASTSSTIATSADLRLTLADDPDPNYGGGTVVYELMVTNDGPSDAQDVVLTETLPADFSVASATRCAISGQTVTCAAGTVAAGSTISRTVTADVALTANGVYSATANVVSTTDDPNSSNDAALAETTIIPAADLAISLTDAPDPVTAGQTMDYTLTVSNMRPLDAFEVQAVLTLPTQTAFQTASAGCTLAANIVTCDIGTLGANATVNQTVTVSVAGDASGAMTGTASVSGAQSELNPVDNTDSESTTILPAIDLAISITDTPDPVIAGQSLEFTLTAENLSTHSASNVTAVFTLPLHTTFNTADADCTALGSVVTCAIGSLSGGSSTERHIEVQVASDANGVLDGTAVIFGDEFDPVAANNMADASTAVSAAADLTVATIGEPETAHIGEVFSVTFAITNAGPSMATGVSFTVTVPSSFTVMTLAPSQGTCSGVVCSLGSLAAHSTATVTVAGANDSSGLLQIDSQVGADTADPSPGGETAQAEISITQYFVYLPIVLKPGTNLYIFNDNTGGDVIFAVRGTPVRCTVPNNTTQFCGTFAPGTYAIDVISQCGPPATFERTYAAGDVTTRVFCR